MNRGAKPAEQASSIQLPRRTDYRTVGSARQEIPSRVEKDAPQRLILDATRLSYCDAAGAALILRLKRDQTQRGGEFAVTGASVEMADLLNLYHEPATEPLLSVEPASSARRRSSRWVETIGKDVRTHVGTWMTALATFGATARAIAESLRRPKQLRGSELLRLIETDGARALPIALLLGLLMGMVIAFKAAVQLRRFGAELYIANLLALASFRQLGPFHTAVILAGRSGAAFATEIGTMQVGEEVEALVTMGIDPLSFLIFPRLLTLMVAAPLLTPLTDIANLAGGVLVFQLSGVTAGAYEEQVLQTANFGDLLDGIAKSMLFGTLIAFAGCLRGRGAARSCRWAKCAWAASVSTNGSAAHRQEPDPSSANRRVDAP